MSDEGSSAGFDEFQFLEGDARRWGLSPGRMTVRREKIAAAGGAVVSALVWGEHPRFAFLHGAGLHAHAWDSTIMALDRPAVAVDLPGHGDSQWRDDLDYRPTTIAAACADAVAALGLPPVTLVGHSLGGLTASALVGMRPELVERLVLVDSVPGRREGGGPSRIQEFMSGKDSHGSIDELIDRAVEHGMGDDRAVIRRGLLLNTRVRADGRIVFKHHFASLPTDRAIGAVDPELLWRTLENADMPVLLVYGTTGFLQESEVDEFLERVPGSSAVALDAGHNVHRERPLELADAIRSFAD